ncbi:hypothetical protein GWK47_009632 [Chionoecetes opilio]|uniref:Uncharacterized protein n=1 Tax=Chionoecetes opilio TaxID=41210 RepID=A0A8J4XYH2_CHIOP|nr:hypothetical protein GWK47_009632 [Chionoecetes opilio]
MCDYVGVNACIHVCVKARPHGTESCVEACSKHCYGHVRIHVRHVSFGRSNPRICFQTRQCGRFVAGKCGGNHSCPKNCVLDTLPAHVALVPCRASFTQEDLSSFPLLSFYWSRIFVSFLLGVRKSNVMAVWKDGLRTWYGYWRRPQPSVIPGNRLPSRGEVSRCFVVPPQDPEVVLFAAGASTAEKGLGSVWRRANIPTSMCRG